MPDCLSQADCDRFAECILETIKAKCEFEGHVDCVPESSGCLVTIQGIKAWGSGRILMQRCSQCNSLVHRLHSPGSPICEALIAKRDIKFSRAIRFPCDLYWVVGPHCVHTDDFSIVIPETWLRRSNEALDYGVDNAVLISVPEGDDE